MIRIEMHEEGVLLPVRAQPGSRSNDLRGEQDGAIKVCVTQIAEKGKANKAIRDVLCQKLRLKKSQVELVSGETSSNKRFLVRDIDVTEIRNRIAACGLLADQMPGSR